MVTWQPDVLGDGFEACTLQLGDWPGETERDAVATLVRAPGPQPRQRSTPVRDWFRRTFQGPTTEAAHLSDYLHGVDVLSVHGWSDYFFQPKQAAFWTSRGARFYAIDLRRYGRSLRAGDAPGLIHSLDAYDADIGLALQAIREDPPRDQADQPAPHDDRPQASRRRPLVMLGHSTGGLIFSLWLHRHPEEADALVLNSPWLEFQLSRPGRQLMQPLLDLREALQVEAIAPQVDNGTYTRAQREVGPEDEIARINFEWRPEKTNPVRGEWLKAVTDGHEAVSRGLSIDVPIFTMLSKRWRIPGRWDDEMTRADTVLEVDEIARAALKLGSRVTVDRIDGALHDVFLSAPKPRADAYNRLDTWMRGWAATREATVPSAR